MHDYPDEKCRIILNNTVAAMDNDSVILIDEVVLPDKGAHPYSLDKDIVSQSKIASNGRRDLLKASYTQLYATHSMALH